MAKITIHVEYILHRHIVESLFCVDFYFFLFSPPTKHDGKINCLWPQWYRAIIVEPACGERDILVTTSVRCVCVVRACMRCVLCVHPDLSGP